MSTILDKGTDLHSVDKVAAELGIDPKRLLGYGVRNKVGDPIGGLVDGVAHFYGWSLETLRKRIADQPAVAP